MGLVSLTEDIKSAHTSAPANSVIFVESEVFRFLASFIGGYFISTLFKTVIKYCFLINLLISVRVCVCFVFFLFYAAVDFFVCFCFHFNRYFS